jgi:hypothetical protein
LAGRVLIGVAFGVLQLFFYLSDISTFWSRRFWDHVGEKRENGFDCILELSAIGDGDRAIRSNSIEGVLQEDLCAFEVATTRIALGGRANDFGIAVAVDKDLDDDRLALLGRSRAQYTEHCQCRGQDLFSK